MISEKKILNMLGLARRAGRVASGGFQTENAVKSGKAYLVIIAKDASENTRKMFRDKCRYYQVPICEFATREVLGHAIGEQMRVCAAVTDEQFARTIERMLTEYNDGGRENGDRSE